MRGRTSVFVFEQFLLLFLVLALHTLELCKLRAFSTYSKGADGQRCARTNSMYFMCTAFSSSPRTCFCASSAAIHK